MGCVRSNRIAATRDAPSSTHAHVLPPHVASLVGGGAWDAHGWAARNISELLRAIVLARTDWRVGGESRRGVCSSAERPRCRPQRGRRRLVLLEAGIGFAFLALVIGYLPVLYQSFSRREVSITLLDARAGSPPSAEELLRGSWSDPEELTALLGEWERWSAEVLESHLSYPVLSYYRSQHDNQSWLTALTTILDASALLIAGIDQIGKQQALRTFKVARHAVVDLAQVVNAH